MQHSAPLILCPLPDCLQVVSDPGQLARLLQSVHTGSAKLGQPAPPSLPAPVKEGQQAAAAAAAAAVDTPWAAAGSGSGSGSSFGSSCGQARLQPPPVVVVSGRDVCQAQAPRDLQEAAVCGAVEPLGADLAGATSAVATAAQQPPIQLLPPPVGGPGVAGSAVQAAAEADPTSCKQGARTSRCSARTGAGTTGGRLWRELAVVFGRTLADILRNPSLLLLHWLMALGMGVLMGCIFWQVRGPSSIRAAWWMDRVLACHWQCSLLACMGVCNTV